MTDSTVVEFQCQREIWPEVDAWADAEGYALKEPGETRLYQKGTGALNGARRLSRSQRGSDVRLEAWVQFWQVVRLLTVPPKMGIESGPDPRGVLPRKKARTEVNKLLEQLGGPAVE